MSGRGGGRYHNDDINVPIKDMEPLRKIFVGGLTPNTNDDTLKEHFSQYGQLSDFVVIKDMETNVSRKFGFVTFTDLEAAHNCLAFKKHVIDGKEVEAKRACKREIVDKIKEVRKAGDKLKIFVGGLSKSTTEDGLRSLFDNHKELRLKTETVSIAVLRETKESRGFAFVSFEEDDHVAQVATVVHFKIDDRTVDCRIADPKGLGRGGPGGRGDPRYGAGFAGGFNAGYGAPGYGAGGAGFGGRVPFGGGRGYGGYGDRYDNYDFGFGQEYYGNGYNNGYGDYGHSYNNYGGRDGGRRGGGGGMSGGRGGGGGRGNRGAGRYEYH